MSVVALSDTPWVEVANLLASHTGPKVAILPLGATEAHGPHLGLGTDVTIAEAMAGAGASQLAARGCLVLILPALPYAPVSWAGSLPGSVGPSAETYTALVLELLVGTWSWGPDVIAIANSHFDPEAIGALRTAVATAEQQGVRVAFADLTRRRLAERLDQEFRSGACHAGSYETSIVLAACPERVRAAIASSLPHRDVSLPAAMGAGARNFADIGAPDAWVGRPAEATADHGNMLIAELGAILADAISECLQRPELGGEPIPR